MSGGFMDLLAQLRSQTDLLAVGVLPWLEPNLAVGVVLGLAAGALVAGAGHSDERAATTAPRALWCLVGLALLAVPLLALSASIFAKVFSTASFAVFGVVLGVTGLQLTRERRLTPAIVAGLFALAMGWTVAISIGDASPAHACGMLAAILADRRAQNIEDRPLLIVPSSFDTVPSWSSLRPFVSTSPLASCRMLDVEPWSYLRDCLISRSLTHCLLELGPLNWTDTSQRIDVQALLAADPTALPPSSARNCAPLHRSTGACHVSALGRTLTCTR